MSKVNDKIFAGLQAMLAAIPPHVKAVVFDPVAFRSKFGIGTIGSKAMIDLIDDMLTWEDTYPKTDVERDAELWTISNVHLDLYQLSRVSKLTMDFDTMQVKAWVLDSGEDEDEEGSDEG
jgi:hypothetical protein